MPAGVWRFLRFICYTALFVAVAGVASLVLPFALDVCRDAGGNQMTCDTPIYRKIFEAGFTIVMFGAFTGLPAGLAAGGVGFLLHDIVAWFRAD